LCGWPAAGSTALSTSTCCGLNLVVAAIVLWNTVYLERAIATLRDTGIKVPDELLQDLSPLGARPERGKGLPVDMGVEIR
jgi:hypothetical protein